MSGQKDNSGAETTFVLTVFFMLLCFWTPLALIPLLALILFTTLDD